MTVELERAAQVPVDPAWINASGHMSAGQYIVVFETAYHDFMATAGAASPAAAPFLLEMHTCYLGEARIADRLDIHVHVLAVSKDRLNVMLLMTRASDGRSLATTELDVMNIDLVSRKPAPWHPLRFDRLQALARAHSNLALPKQAGRGIRRLEA